jgi:hypothetical protein
MAWSWVQDSPLVIAGAQTMSPTLGSSSTAGNLLIAYMTMGVSTSFGWTLPTNWVQGPSATNASGGNQAMIWYLLPANNPGGITSVLCNVTPSGTNETIRGVVSEFNPGGGSVTFNATAVGTAGTVSSDPVSVTGVAAGDLLLACFQEHFSASTAVTWTPPTGFTVSGQETTSATYLLWGGYQLSATAGSQTVTGSTGTAATAAPGWAGAVCSFSASSGASPTPAAAAGTGVPPAPTPKVALGMTIQGV